MKVSKKKGRFYRGIKEGVILEQFESIDDEVVDNFEEVMNTWELGIFFGFIILLISEVIELLLIIIRSVMIIVKLRG